MMNAKLDYAIATEICGYPKDGWVPLIVYDECRLVRQTKPAPCYRESKVFSPSSDWALAGPLLEQHGVDLEMLLFNKIPGMLK